MNSMTEITNNFKPLERVLQQGVWGTVGPEFLNASKKVATCAGVKYGLVTFSATAALECILRGWNIGYDDEVIVAAWSDPVDAMVTAAVGATPVFADVCARTHTLICKEITPWLTEHTKAVIADLAVGNVCDAKALAKYCRDKGLYLILNMGDAWGTSIDGEPIARYADAAFADMSQGKRVDVGLAGAALTDQKENWELFYAYHNCGRPFGDGCTLSADEILGGDLRVAEWQAALIPALLENLQPMTETTKPEYVFMPDQPFFTDPYFVKLTGCKTVYEAADYPHSLQAAKKASAAE